MVELVADIGLGRPVGEQAVHLGQRGSAIAPAAAMRAISPASLTRRSASTCRRLGNEVELGGQRHPRRMGERVASAPTPGEPAQRADQLIVLTAA